MKIFLRFARYLVPYWRHLIATLVSTFLFVGFSAAAYWLAGSFLQVVFTGQLGSAVPSMDSFSLNLWLKNATSRLLVAPSHTETLLRTAGFIVVAFLGKNLFGYLQLFFVSFIEQRVIKDLRDELFHHFMFQDLAFFHGEKRGHLLSTTLNDVQQLNQALNKSFTKAIRDPFNAIVLLVLLITVSPLLSLSALVIVPAVGWSILYLGRHIKRHSVLVQEAFAGITSHLQESIGGIRIVKAFAAETFERGRFHSTNTDLYHSAIRRERLRRMVIPLNEFSGMLIFCGILYVGGSLVLVRHQIDSEDFIRFLVLLFGLFTPLLSMSNLLASIRVAEASGNRVFRVLDAEPFIRHEPGKKTDIQFEKRLALETVSFRYATDQPDVLQQIQLEVQRGEHVAVVGKSGSGKSTLVNLLPRFYDPTDGRITLDDVDIREYDLIALRNLYGVVTQQVILFHDTIEANIAFGLDHVDQDTIQHAAVEAFAHDFIEELPDGYQTLVGEEGALLSGGQRQRISIARALLRNPEIVILDEATSALDPESEQLVSQALSRLTRGRTVITVSHRLSAIRDASRIFVLDKGRLVDSGSHDQLLQRCQIYIDLARQQQVLTSTEPLASHS